MSAARPLPVSPLGPDTADPILAARAASGDAGAFERIMRRHNRLLFRTARSLLRSDAEAEDVLQEAYLRAWRGLASFRAEARLSTWLVRIVMNEALMRGRRRGADVVPIAEEAMAANPDEGPESGAMRAEVRALVESGIDALPESFRTVFVLRAVEEWSVEEVAAALELPEATVRTRFFRARGLMRERLARHLDAALGEAFSFDGARCDRIVARVVARLGEARERPGE